MPHLGISRNVRFVLLSLLIQVPLAVFLGHQYDEKVFMVTGYLVASGLNPYHPYIGANIFHTPLFVGVIPSIGYPPPWPLLLGIIYRLSYSIVPNLFLYNFAIKVPVIVGNVCLAYLVRNIIMKLDADEKKAKFAWLFVLFNPFVLLTTVAWGEFDTVVALFCLASLYLLSRGKTKESAVLLALGIALKPIALPLIGLPFLFPSNNSFKRNFEYLMIFSLILLTAYFAPFFLEGWALPWAQNEWNAQLQMAGGLTPFNLVEIFQNSFSLPSTLAFLGYLWVPALVAGYVAVYRNRPNSMNDLVHKAIGLILIFFLTRSWLSEPNINLVLPLMLITLDFKRISFRGFHFLWVIPLVFLFLNTSVFQLFFLVVPSISNLLTHLDMQIRSWRLWARFLIVVPWQILAWNLVSKETGKN